MKNAILRKLLLILAVIQVFSFLGCSKKAGSEIEENKTLKFALHNYSEQFESSVLIANGVREAAKKYGVDLIEADINADTQKILPNIENFLLQDVDLIIDATWYADIGATSVAICKGDEIPIISCDVVFSDTEAYMVGADNYESGRIIGAYMLDIVKEKWNGKLDYLVLCWPQQGGPAVDARMQGAVDIFMESGVDINEDNIVWVDTSGEPLKAKTVAADFLTANPDSNRILFGANNDASGLGVLAGVQTSNREDDCMIYSYGGEPSAVNNFKSEENCWVGSVSFGLDKYGEIAVKNGLEILKGNDVPRRMSPDLFVVDRSNVWEYAPE